MDSVNDNLDYLLEYFENQYSSVISRFRESFKNRVKIPSANELTTFFKENSNILDGKLINSFNELSEKSNAKYFLLGLDNSKEVTRANCAYMLGFIRDTKSINKLVDLTYDSSNGVKALAVHALGLIGDVSAMPHLISLINEGSKEVQCEVIFSLGEIGDPISVLPLKEKLKDNDCKELVIDALGKIGDNCVKDDLLSLVKDSDDVIRARATYALRNIKSADVVNALISLLNDDSYEVVLMAAFSLAETKSPKAVLPLLEAYENGILDENEVERSILKIGKASFEPLKKALKIKKESIRFLSAKILGNLGIKDASEPLRNALENEYVYVIGEVIKSTLDAKNMSEVDSIFKKNIMEDIIVIEDIINALGKVGNSRAVLTLEKSLESEHINIRNATNKSIKNIFTRITKDDTSYIAAFLSSKYEAVRINALKKCRELDIKSFEPKIEDFLKSQIELEKYEAALYLGQLGNKKSIGALSEMASLDSDSELVKEAKSILDNLEI